MAADLPKPTTTTDVLLVAVVERLDALLEALTPEPPAPATRRRATRTKPAEEA